MANIRDVIFIFLGSFLTFVATILVESIKNGREQEAKKKNFKLITKQEFESTKKTLEKIKTVFEYKSYFEYSLINALDKSIQELESLRHDSIFLNDEEVQEMYINLISELSKFSSSIRGIQDMFYVQQRALANDKVNTKKIQKGILQKESIFINEKENQEAFQQRSTQEFIALVEINRKLDDIVGILTV